MVKMIASDMDGTLLDEEGNIPEETFQLIEDLNEAGIHFAASSGRRLDTLLEFFAPVAGHMDFVASNGAQVMVGGTLVDLEVFSRVALKKLVKMTAAFRSMHLAVFDSVNSYLLDDEACFERELDKNLPRPVRVHDLPGAEVNIVKASVYCDDAIMDMSYALTRELGDDFVFAPSGSKWIDVMQRGVNKATGMRQVMDERHVGAEDVMAFGDAMNDYELLRVVGTPVAMGNARSAIKQIAVKTIGTNADHSVQAEMRSLVQAAQAGER